MHRTYPLSGVKRTYCTCPFLTQSGENCRHLMAHTSWLIHPYCSRLAMDVKICSARPRFSIKEDDHVIAEHQSETQRISSQRGRTNADFRNRGSHRHRSCVALHLLAPQQGRVALGLNQNVFRRFDAKMAAHVTHFALRVALIAMILGFLMAPLLTSISTWWLRHKASTY